MKLTVVKPFGRYSTGDVIPEVPANQARAWLARGIVREAKDVPAAPVDRMMRAGRAMLRKAREEA